MCLLDSLLGGRRRAPEDDEPRPWISRRHLLGFYPIFRIEGAADHLDPEDWIPEPSLSKWRSSRGSDLQGFAKPFRKALSKTPQHHGSPPCLNFEGSPPWHGRCATRHPFVRNPDQCARPTRGFPSRCAPAPTSSAVFRPIFRIEAAADHLDPEDGFRLPVAT